MSEFEELIEAAMKQVEETLRHAMDGSSVLGDMGSGLIESGGKRIRPELLMASYLAGGGKDLTETVQAAAAFELIHTASLIHDDITDDPTLRRRRPAPHRRYGLSRALIAGDYIFAKSFQLLAGANEEVSNIIANAALATAEGEHLELILSFDATVTKDQHEDIMMKKTAALFTAAAMVGAVMGGMDDEHRAALETFATNLGMAFQVTDDVLDLEPSAALTGKPSGMDLREGRMNTVILAALEKLKGGERDKVVRVFMASSPPPQDVEAALVLIRGTGAGGVAINKAQKLIDSAMASLEPFDEPVREHLEAMAKEVVPQEVMKLGIDPSLREDEPLAVKEFFRDAAEPEDRQIIVVGAGPAGSTAARYAAEAGADVLLIDRRSVVGSPVQCAGFLPSEDELADMLPDVPDPDALFTVDDEFELARTYETVIVSPQCRRTYLKFEGRTIDRARWDPHLVDMAVKAGAEFRPSTQAMAMESGVLLTDRGAFLPGVVIAADGPNSKIRSAVGLPEPKLIAPALNAPSKHLHGGKVEMHFNREAAGGYAWVIPAGDGMSHVGLGVDPRRKDVDLKGNLREFAEKVGADLGPVTGGFVPSAGPVKRTVKGNVMLVGDAAGHVMASNGGGVPIAMAAGRAAGQVAASTVEGKGDLREYERRWRTEVGDVLATAARFRWAAGLPIWSPLAMEMAMWAIPKDQMLRALKCQRIFNAF